MPAMSDELAKLRAEQDRINAMPGRTAWVKLARLSRTAKIFAGNASVLLGHLKRMQDPAVLLPTVSNYRQASPPCAWLSHRLLGVVGSLGWWSSVGSRAPVAAGRYVRAPARRRGRRGRR